MQRSTHCRLVLIPLLRAFLVTLALSSPTRTADAADTTPAREPVVGLPCEGCEAVFVGMPAAPPARARIAPVGEPGVALRITGRVLDRTGKPAPGIVVYAYQTDAGGLYPPDPVAAQAGVRHGRLRGWARTDAGGEYQFDTIRPGGYPGTGIPQHIHMHVLEPGRCTYYIDDILFTDDPRLSAEERERHERGRGGSGIATPTKGADGVWNVRRDIRLGEQIAGYPAAP
jgi:protocatechuate 3,4-dioxygenase beta subunit